MKKIIFLVSFLFIITICVLIYYFIDSKSYFDEEVIELNKKQVDLVDSKALKKIIINDVIISNIHIEDNHLLKFNISSTKTDLNNSILTIIFYNDLAKKPGNAFNVNLSNVIENNSVTMDVSEIYNNPNKIEFDIK